MSQKLFNPDGPEAIFAQANKLIEAGNPAGAAGLLSSLIAEHPDFGRAHNHLGYLYETQFHDLEQAEEHYKTCLKLCPEYPAIYYNYAVLLSTQNRIEELETLLKKALEVRGINHSKIHNEFGILYEKQGKYTEALAAYRKAIQYSFSQKDINTYRVSIERTRQKKMYFKQFPLVEFQA